LVAAKACETQDSAERRSKEEHPAEHLGRLAGARNVSLREKVRGHGIIATERTFAACGKLARMSRVSSQWLCAKLIVGPEDLTDDEFDSFREYPKDLTPIA